MSIANWRRGAAGAGDGAERGRTGVRFWYPSAGAGGMATAARWRWRRRRCGAGGGGWIWAGRGAQALPLLRAFALAQTGMPGNGVTARAAATALPAAARTALRGGLSGALSHFKRRIPPASRGGWATAALLLGDKRAAASDGCRLLRLRRRLLPFFIGSVATEFLARLAATGRRDEEKS